MKKIFRLFTFSFYLFLSLVFFICIAEPAFNGAIDLKVWADAPTYEAFAKNFSNASDLVTISGNFLGPVAIIKMFNNNRLLIFLFNCILLVISYWLLSKTKNINKSWLLFFTLVNPTIFISLMSVNKEIISFLFASLLVMYLNHRKWGYLFLCLITSFLARWQLTLFLLVYLGMLSPVMRANVNRKKALLFLVLGISAVYILLSKEVKVMESTASLFADGDTQGSNLFVKLNDIQSQYGYFIVVVPKVLQNLFGGMVRMANMFDWSDFYNNFVVLWQCILFFVMAVFLVINKKVDIYNDTFYFAVVYCVVFATTPIVQTRYFFPVYVLFSVLLSVNHSRSKARPASPPLSSKDAMLRPENYGAKGVFCPQFHRVQLNHRDQNPADNYL